MSNRLRNLKPLKMTTRKTHKVRGATFESDTRDLFREEGYESERLARTGAKDEGDVVVKDFLGHTLVLECKAPGKDGRIDLSGWQKEAQLEGTHYAEARKLSPEQVLSAVLIKARGKPLKEAYIVFRLGDLLSE
jgi:hypothetical protein